MKLKTWKSDHRLPGEKQDLVTSSELLDQASLDANTTCRLKLYSSINSSRWKQVDLHFLSLATKSILTKIPCGLDQTEKRWGQ